MNETALLVRIPHRKARKGPEYKEEFSMKKLFALLLALTLVLSLGGTAALAAGGRHGQGMGRGRQAQNFVDADSDGVCDRWTEGRGQNFVDADGDGVCDNWTGCRGGRSVGRWACLGQKV